MGYGKSEQQQTSNNDFEYSISKSNKIATTNQSEQEIMANCPETVTTTQPESSVEAGDSLLTSTPDQIEFTTSYKNKNVTIHLEFPSQSNEKAADDFFRGLKELYLKKVENRSMQLKESALQSMSTNEKENEYYD